MVDYGTGLTQCICSHLRHPYDSYKGLSAPGVRGAAENSGWKMNTKGGHTCFSPKLANVSCSSCSKQQIISEKGVLMCVCPLVFSLIHLWPICCWEFTCIQSSYFVFFALHGNRAQLKKYIITRSVKYNIVFPPYIKACTFWSSKIAQTTLFPWQWHELFDQRKICKQKTVH